MKHNLVQIMLAVTLFSTDYIWVELKQRDESRKLAEIHRPKVLPSDVESSLEVCKVNPEFKTCVIEKELKK